MKLEHEEYLKLKKLVYDNFGINLTENKKNLIVNLGTGKGHTVFEVIAAASKVTGKNIDYEIVKRRAGDPEKLYACSEFANKILGWEPKYSDLETIFKSMMPVYL